MTVDVISKIERPIVLAPMAGGPSTPELCAAVSNAGGLGFLAAGYLSPEELDERIDATLELTSRPFGVNLFVPGPRHTDTAAWQEFRARLAQLTGAPLPEAPTWSDDYYVEKLERIVNSSVPVVSFTFGNPTREVADRLRAAGKSIVLHATTPGEVSAAAELADVITVQGNEAGGHRASPIDEDNGANYTTRALLVDAAAHHLPVIAAGGVGCAQDVRDLLDRGATAVQVGTRFLTAHEAGTKPLHREALLTMDRETVLTRAFSGRTARAISNTWTVELTKCSPRMYPEVHYLTSPARKAAYERGDAEFINLWAGTGYRHCRAASAAEIIEELCQAL
ncbi:NAD(P)H-dependent flavin oxidoreductase [Corynebacterium gerontici]|uniref:Propionate 3-nitronate monooxygenase n=1 Tax=Corynebacterium gerontici TaxID=2079234 RepID=A0A3G6J4P9_9CORY|nr:nitronate monooxygenase [Corynebacterium gerontici]AZA11918.1 Nitronate monooxygenase [Corynebacterium gerontici]